jgi:hypothetical protein
METKIFGSRKGGDDSSAWEELSEVTVASNPADLRRLAAFLTQCANDIEEHGTSFGHTHLRDEPDLRPWTGKAADVIVTRAKALSD